jgi:hypothetical protein
MSYINEGDLLVCKTYGTKYVAISSDYVKRILGNGEYIEDCSFIPAVNTLNPETGHHGWMFLRDVTKVSG